MNEVIPVLAIFASAVAASAVAQDPAYVVFVEQTNASVPPPTSEDIAVATLSTLQDRARHQGTCVPTGVNLEAPRTAAAVAAISQAVQAGQIKNGWTVYGRPEGCAGSDPVRFLMLRMPDDALRALIVNEGETLANPSLMRDASASAAIVAFQLVATADAACTGDDMEMGATRIAERGPDLGPEFHGAYYAGSWSEVWTFRVCGRTAEVPVRFTADGQGGAYFDVPSREAHLIE